MSSALNYHFAWAPWAGVKVLIWFEFFKQYVYFKKFGPSSQIIKIVKAWLRVLKVAYYETRTLHFLFHRVVLTRLEMGLENLIIQTEEWVSKHWRRCLMFLHDILILIKVSMNFSVCWANYNKGNFHAFITFWRRVYKICKAFIDFLFTSESLQNIHFPQM